MIEEALKKFDFIVRTISKIMSSEDTGVEDIEPYLEELLDLINLNIGYRNQFAKKFIDLLESGSGIPLEIFWFCMHELKWNEVYQYVEKYKNDSEDPRKRRAAELILESFSNDWEDAIMFERFA